MTLVNATSPPSFDPVKFMVSTLLGHRRAASLMESMSYIEKYLKKYLKQRGGVDPQSPPHVSEYLRESRDLFKTGYTVVQRLRMCETEMLILYYEYQKAEAPFSEIGLCEK